MLNITAIIDAYTWQNSASAYGKQKYTDAVAKAYNFKTRDEYLQWVKEWKVEYALNAAESRGYKSARKISSKPYKGKVGRAAQMEVLRRRQIARAMLYARSEAKKLSWQMKQEQLAKTK